MIPTHQNPTHQFRPTGLRTALNAEWSCLVDAGLPTGWRRSAALACCGTLDDVLGLIRERADPTLGSLLARCVAGDELAGRTVLQAMLGKLVRLAGCDPYAGLDDYVAAMWLRIRTYPLRERPVRIAGNLTLDTLKSVQRQSRTPHGVEVTPYPPAAFLELLSDWVEPTQDDLAARQVIDTAAQVGLINEDTRTVLTSVYVDGLSGVAAADRHGRSAGAIRFQCHKALHLLAQHGPMLAEAA